jgi:hypothetical protein
MTTTAAAPSLVCDELPAVTEPLAWNAGFSFASASSDVSRRGPSSTARTGSDPEPPAIGPGWGLTPDLPSSTEDDRKMSGWLVPADRPAGMAETALSRDVRALPKRPASIAATARWWLRSAKASCSSREIP